MIFETDIIFLEGVEEHLTRMSRSKNNSPEISYMLEGLYRDIQELRYELENKLEQFELGELDEDEEE